LAAVLLLQRVTLTLMDKQQLIKSKAIPECLCQHSGIAGKGGMRGG
jgi:hypothetical protein